MKPSYTFLEHTADVLFQAQATELNQLFEQCALALEDTQVDVKLVEAKINKTITLKSNNLERLLFEFLEELLFYKDSEQLILGKFNIEIKFKNKEYFLKCQAYGEKLNLDKHDPKIDVKAITMHLFEIKKLIQGWQATVLVDI